LQRHNLVRTEYCSGADLAHLATVERDTIAEQATMQEKLGEGGRLIADERHGRGGFGASDLGEQPLFPSETMKLPSPKAD
jgi:hypothetical protein